MTGDGSNSETADAVAEEIRQRGGQAVADSHSVTTPEGGQAIIDTALRTWGRVDIVINNAGIVCDAPFDDMTADRLDPLLDVHLKGAFHLTRPVWKVMREQRYGRVLNTCSAAGILGAERMSNYGSAKTGLIGFTRVLAAEGADRNIKVNAIARSATPGCSRTPSTPRAGRTTRPTRPCSTSLWANIFRNWTRRWWLRSQLSDAPGLSCFQGDLHGRRWTRRTILHRQDKGVLQPGAVGRRGAESSRRDPRRGRLYRPRRARRRDDRAVRDDHDELTPTARRRRVSSPTGR